MNKNNNKIRISENYLTLFLYKYNNFKYIHNDKTIKETYKIIILINNIINIILKKINNLTSKFSTNISNEYIVDKLNNIKKYIYYMNNFAKKLQEYKSEIDFISELENSDFKNEYIYEYKNASSYIEKYIMSFIEMTILFSNRILYIDDFLNNIILLF